MAALIRCRVLAQQATSAASVLLDAATSSLSIESKAASKEWPEREQRGIRWLSAREAAESVKEPMLGEIIRRSTHKTVD